MSSRKEVYDWDHASGQKDRAQGKYSPPGTGLASIAPKEHRGNRRAAYDAGYENADSQAKDKDK